MSELPGLPPLEAAHEAFVGPLIPAQAATSETKIINLANINHSAAVVSEPMSNDWLKENIEPSLVTPVSRLLHEELSPFTSSANAKNTTGTLSDSPANIGIMIDSSPKCQQVIRRANQLQTLIKLAGITPEQAGFNFTFIEDPRSFDKFFIEVAVAQDDTVQSVQDKFTVIIDQLLTEDGSVEENKDPFASPPKQVDWSPPDPESVVSLDIHRYTKALATKEAFQAEQDFLYSILHGAPFNTLRRLEAKKAKLDNLITEAAGDEEKQWEINKDIKLIQAEMREDPSYFDCISLLGKLQRIEDPYDPAILLDASDKRATTILTYMFEAAKRTQIEQNKEAPFKEHSNNSQNEWLLVTSKSVDEYMKSRLFFETDGITYDTNKIVIEAGTADGIDVPLDMFVYASGFKSWAVGNTGKPILQESEYGSYDTRSIDVMKHYAALPSVLPPINTVNVYVQPNGKIFADNANGGSHRLGAAILRGDSTVKANEVRVVTVKRNYI